MKPPKHKRMASERTHIMKTILVGFTAFALLAFPAAASAQLSTTFVGLPFSDTNLVPGSSVSGSVTLTNGFETPQDAQIEAVNVSDPDLLSEQMTITIAEVGGSVIHDGLSFNTFLTTGIYPLSNIASGESKTYTLSIILLSGAPETYQGKTLDFDFCVGFAGDEFQCGDTNISPPIDNGGGGDGGGGGGTTVSGGGNGQVGGTIRLTIFNEAAFVLSAGTAGVNGGEASIEWDTNLFATSQVIYGPVSHPDYPFSININQPNFGYPFSTDEIAVKTEHHTVTLTGLTGGETYVYRVVSRASPPTVSLEHTFTVAMGGGESSDTDGENGPTISSGSGGVGNTGTGSGDLRRGDLESASTTASSSEEEQVNNLAAALFGLPDGWGGFWGFLLLVLLLLLIALIVWFVMRSRENK
jgi:hypothetical protein